MVMDADLGGRSEREREEGKQKKRRGERKLRKLTHTKKKSNAYIYDFLFCSTGKILSTRRDEIFSSTMWRFPLCIRD